MGIDENEGSEYVGRNELVVDEDVLEEVGEVVEVVLKKSGQDERQDLWLSK